MSVKILVSSSSTIDLIEHPDTIESIPDIIYYSNNEEYLDGVDINPSIFYNRLKHDKNLPDIQMPKKEDLYQIIKEASKNNDQVILVLPASGIIYYDDEIVDKLVEEFKNVTVYNSSTVGYPLAYLCILLDTNIKKGTSIEDALVLMEKMERNTEVICYSPVKDVLTQDSFEKSMKKRNKLDKFYLLNYASLIEVKNKSFVDFNDVFRYLIRQTEDMKAEIFITYTYENSYYVSYLEEKLLGVFTSMKKIKKVIVPPAAGVKMGANVVGVGYIKLD